MLAIKTKEGNHLTVIPVSKFCKAYDVESRAVVDVLDAMKKGYRHPVFGTVINVYEFHLLCDALGLTDEAFIDELFPAKFITVLNEEYYNG